MQGKQYRLDDQIITGYDDFFYTWEKNMAMGEHRIGNCFVFGDILIFGPWTQKKEGCLRFLLDVIRYAGLDIFKR